MKTLLPLAAIAAATLVAAAPASAQSGGYRAAPAQDEDARFDAAQRRFDSEYRVYQEALQRYRSTRQTARWDDRGPGRGPGYYDSPDYDPARDYRTGNYQERVLANDESVYRGNDGRYYCRRSDGTTGLIVGAAAGGLFGNVIAGRRSSTVGTLLGAIAGGALGSSVDRNQIRCR